jgi:hypothetical protein
VVDRLGGRCHLERARRVAGGDVLGGDGLDDRLGDDRLRVRSLREGPRLGDRGLLDRLVGPGDVGCGLGVGSRHGLARDVVGRVLAVQLRGRRQLVGGDDLLGRRPSTPGRRRCGRLRLGGLDRPLGQRRVGPGRRRVREQGPAEQRLGERRAVVRGLLVRCLLVRHLLVRGLLVRHLLVRGLLGRHLLDHGLLVHGLLDHGLGTGDVLLLLHGRGRGGHRRLRRALVGVRLADAAGAEAVQAGVVPVERLGLLAAQHPAALEVVARPPGDDQHRHTGALRRGLVLLRLVVEQLVLEGLVLGVPVASVVGVVGGLRLDDRLHAPETGRAGSGWGAATGSASSDVSASRSPTATWPGCSAPTSAGTRSSDVSVTRGASCSSPVSSPRRCRMPTSSSSSDSTLTPIEA